MPRSARLDAPGVAHHVIIRGIERRKISSAHFVFRTRDGGLSTLMRRLLTEYAVHFNRRHNRHGQLFQNRYKSILCQKDIYLKELVRYIHLNPLCAKIVSDISELDKYEYSGHSVLLGNKKGEWQDTEYVLSYFGRKSGQ